MILLNSPAKPRAVFYAALAGLLVTSAPAIAQDSDESRIRKLESEIRALQRQVFPGGDGRYFEPEISGAASTGPSAASQTTAVTDILARLDALESSIQTLTSQVEVANNTQEGMEQRLSVLENAVSSGTGTRTASSTPPGTLLPGSSAASTTTSGQTQSATPTPTPTPAQSAGPSAERLAAVQAIAKPATDDAGDDDYSYGFRLWDAGYYPEAQQALAAFVEKYPDHWRTTYGRNLLGRAFLDNGQAREAAPWFLQNYQADAAAARAPDSLLYLAKSMIELGDTDRACIALSEFGETYPAIAAGRLSDDYEASRRAVSCSN